MEKQSYYGPTCDGGPISLESECCEGDDYAQCPNSPCENGPINCPCCVDQVLLESFLISLPSETYCGEASCEAICLSNPRCTVSQLDIQVVECDTILF